MIPADTLQLMLGLAFVGIWTMAGMIVVRKD